jgi:hypothetical protein
MGSCKSSGLTSPSCIHEWRLLGNGDSVLLECLGHELASLPTEHSLHANWPLVRLWRKCYLRCYLSGFVENPIFLRY